MSGSISDYLEAKLLDHSLGGPSYSSPSATHLALFTVAPTDSGGGTEAVDNPGYTRKPISWNNAVPGTGIKTNSTSMTFTATGPWTQVVAIGIFDLSSPGTGNLLYYGNLTTPRTLSATDELTFSPGSLSVSLD